MLEERWVSADRPGNRSKTTSAPSAKVHDVERLMGANVERDEAVFPVDGIDDLGQMTDTRIDEGELEARPADSDQPDEPRVENLEFLESLELRAEETDDPNEAAEEGLTWVPPTDPPVIAGDDGHPEIAAGFGTTALDEPFDADHHTEGIWGEDEVTARVYDALRADALASQYVDDLRIESAGSIIRISGIVDDLEDEEQVLAVAADVSGVRDVRSRIRVLEME
jgi:hypothetical protein